MMNKYSPPFPPRQTLETNPHYIKIKAILEAAECPQCQAQHYIDEYTSEGHDLKGTAGGMACKLMLLKKHECQRERVDDGETDNL